MVFNLQIIIIIIIIVFHLHNRLPFPAVVSGTILRLRDYDTSVVTTRTATTDTVDRDRCDVMSFK